MTTAIKGVIKDLASDKPKVALKAAETVLKKVGYKEPEKKTVLVEMTSPTPKVTFTGGLWTAMDIKLANRAVIVNFKKMLRELYRKEYKK